jgi:hypothetical protein
MTALFALFIRSARPRPVFAEAEDFARAMRIAEIKWLLSEIAAPAQKDPAPQPLR